MATPGANPHMTSIAFTDVHYLDSSARAACVLADGWDAPQGRAHRTVMVSPVAAYRPGAFYERELPCLLAVLAEVPRPDFVVVDGYVFLDAEGTWGLGAHLHQALGGEVPVIGIAKTTFRGSPMAAKLPRPNGAKPLFVTAAGVPVTEALEHATRLHGAYRIPSLLKEVDRLARDGE
jgi:deoxyribonuclease V